MFDSSRNAREWSRFREEDGAGIEDWLPQRLDNVLEERMHRDRSLEYHLLRQRAVASHVPLHTVAFKSLTADDPVDALWEPSGIELDALRARLSCGCYRLRLLVEGPRAQSAADAEPWSRCIL